VVMKTVRADHVPGDVATGPKDLIGLSPKRTLTPGKPVQMADVGPPVIVRKGALLTMTLTTERMQLTATGRALDSGSLGDVVRAMNVQSKLVVEAVVIGPNRVSAQPGAHQIAAR